MPKERPEALDFDLAVGAMIGRPRGSLDVEQSEALVVLLQTLGKTVDEFWSEVERVGRMKF